MHYFSGPTYFCPCAGFYPSCVCSQESLEGAKKCAVEYARDETVVGSAEEEEGLLVGRV